MAIDPSSTYPAQTIADGNYPYGKARNDQVEGDGTGTPLEADLVNDIFGFQQALLGSASLTPSGTPDSASSSQYLLAVRYVATHPISRPVFLYGLDVTTLDVSDGLTVGVTALATFHGGVLASGLLCGGGAFSDPVSFAALATFNGGILTTGLFCGGAAFSGEIALSGAGRIRQHVIYAPDADHTYSEGDGTVIVVEGFVTATRIYKINDAANEGAELELYNWTSNVMTLQNQSGGALHTLAVINGSGIPGYVKLSWHNNGTTTAWHPVLAGS
jgi:hypothetical protein